MKESIFSHRAHVEIKLTNDLPSFPKYCQVIPALNAQKFELAESRIYCEVEGNGDAAIVLINGGPGATHHYFHPHFSRAKSFAKIIYYDQRGCGNSENYLKKDYSIYQAVDDLDQLRARLGIDRWVVLGHSFGGLIAQLYSLYYLKNTMGLVLVASSPGFDTGPSRWDMFLTPEEVNRVKEIRLNKSIPEYQKDYNKNINGNWKNHFFYLPSQKRLCLREYEWINDSECHVLVDESAKDINLLGLFDDFKIPTLIIEGKWDAVWSDNKADEIKENHPNAKAYKFRFSGHYPFEDESDRFFSVLKKFVTDLNQ